MDELKRVKRILDMMGTQEVGMICSCGDGWGEGEPSRTRFGILNIEFYRKGELLPFRNLFPEALELIGNLKRGNEKGVNRRRKDVRIIYNENFRRRRGEEEKENEIKEMGNV